MHYEILADRVRYFKENEEGVAAMCKAMEDMRNEAVFMERKRMAAELLADSDWSHKKIADFCRLTLNDIEELVQTKSVKTA